VPSPQNREEELFAPALEMPAAKGPELLDAICAWDPALRQRLETLPVTHQKADELPPSGAPAIVATIKLDLTEAEDEAVGKTIGRYKILEMVGEGGCGVVYVAEQTEPVRRRVALKVIKLGMDTKAVVTRFEAERREKEPARLSTRLATLKGEELTTTAKRRSADTSKLLDCHNFSAACVRRYSRNAGSSVRLAARANAFRAASSRFSNRRMYPRAAQQG
jgi:hypothetical protein